ncbi:MAG: sulfatase, partial [Planctomycetales bacterium]|nr:sulfatase [Planctomycetales bacterium]
NFFPGRPHLMPNAYKDGKAILQTLRALHAEGTLPSVAEELLFSPTRPTEELYDYHADPFQVTNLAANPEFSQVLAQHRARLDQWIIDSKDQGLESEAMYDSDMAEYLKKPNPEVVRNIALMKQWAKEGK